MDLINRNNTIPFTTKDGSQIRELLSHRNSGIRQQSLAEATILVGQATQEHYHRKTEEIYYILSGSGLMRIGNETRAVSACDAIAIAPGARHKLSNTGGTPLVLLCMCAPPYEHEDTFLTEEPIQQPVA